jgi:hypothetical protein
VAFPVDVLLHEIGHYVFFLAFAFPATTFEVRLLRQGVAAAAAVLPPAQVAIVTAAGLVVTYLIVAAAVYVTRRYGVHPLIVAAGLVAPLRFVSLRFLVVNILAGRPAMARTDEGILIPLTGMPPFIPIATGVICWVGGWVLIVRALPAGERWRSLAVMLAGVVVGLPLYVGVIGPWLLP